MPDQTATIQSRLQTIRREIRGLAASVKAPKRTAYAQGYVAGIRHAASVVTRHIRRSADGKSA